MEVVIEEAVTATTHEEAEKVRPDIKKPKIKTALYVTEFRMPDQMYYWLKERPGIRFGDIAFKYRKTDPTFTPSNNGIGTIHYNTMEWKATYNRPIPKKPLERAFLLIRMAMEDPEEESNWEVCE